MAAIRAIHGALVLWVAISLVFLNAMGRPDPSQQVSGRNHGHGSRKMRHEEDWKAIDWGICSFETSYVPAHGAMCQGFPFSYHAHTYGCLLRMDADGNISFRLLKHKESLRYSYLALFADGCLSLALLAGVALLPAWRPSHGFGVASFNGMMFLVTVLMGLALGVGPITFARLGVWAGVAWVSACVYCRLASPLFVDAREPRLSTGDASPATKGDA